ncbi:MAG TPA: hypothetical protein VI548_03615 [Chitinophagaceae bacterium]|nr:hypothetical protein [Chitinophagaceae bacterium]
MLSKTSGIFFIVIGILLIAYTGFNYVTTEKVVDLGPLQISQEKNHPVQWSPVIGVLLLAGGIIIFIVSKKNRT